MNRIGIGLIGTGSMAWFHMKGYHSIRQAYGEFEPQFVIVSARNEAKLAEFQVQFGFDERSTDWHDVIKHPLVDVVLINSPNNLHAEMVIAAAKAGKHIMCEKPMAMTEQEGWAMCDAVDSADVISLVDFIYIQCPAIAQAKKMIDSGEFGELITFRGWFDASYMSDPATPIQWRSKSSLAGTGAMGDVTAHIISLSDYLTNDAFGGISEVCACWDTVISERPAPKTGQKSIVDTDDLNYILIRYKNGRLGMMYSTRVAPGHDTRLGFEILGSKGSVEFNVNRLNELIVYQKDARADQCGFKTIYANTLHGDYSHYSVYNDTGISYSDVVGIQAQHFLKAVEEHQSMMTDIHYGYYVDRVMEAMQISIAEHRWVNMDEVLKR